MSDSFEGKNVRCPNCGDIFTIRRGLQLADRVERDRRRSERIPALNIRILLEDSLREYPVMEMSAVGLGFDNQGWRFAPDTLLTFDLIEDYQIILKGVKAKVVRINDPKVGCDLLNVKREVAEKVCTMLRTSQAAV